ncbi:GIY-YIG nuclease family protein [Porticoccus sp. W117]|uniref:GIY-YIG nuclease family protein n=1 Tax=Porticoccus sp. W117 TaxID=3054777 RepID=UPI002598F770|nr:GIY-YIG nuclease family protein [Porticoccus sp. W117]MDM3871132.1 GIY-YIG nuclease family protein [Porticoccus sp. W117]
MDKQPAIYILANKRNGTLYTGVTSDLVQRIWQHKQHLVEGFTKQHSINILVYYELHHSMYDAITREKQIKAGSRSKKVKLVESKNPYWNDLYETLL